MNRGSRDQLVQSGTPVTQRRRTGGRVLTLGTLAMIAMLVLSACGPNVEKPYSTISPASPTADDVQSLYELVFWLALIVFIGVQLAIVYSALRFRRTKSGGRRPPQVHGNKRLEIIWTIIPAVVLLIILIPTITTMYDHAAEAEEGDLVIDVYGKQWWWEVHYGQDNGQGGENLGVITANEIHIPVGQEVIFNLRTNNVIHSFWVPRLSGKLDLVPGHVNTLSVTAEEPGEYYGECAEFCGAQHAWMRFKVIAHPVDEFYAWVNGQRTGNPGTTDPDAERPEGVDLAPEAFSICLSCHTVNGVSEYNVTGLDAPASYGPDLTNLACRETIAAGLLVNNRENLEQWVNDPDSVKPGNYMADQITEGLIRDTYGDEGFNELIDYLVSLQPAGGCVGTEGWSPVASPAASPAASPVATPVGG
jgi:cytochrome c oxidase subunit 2